MAHWRTFTSNTGCYRQQFEYGTVNGVYVAYAISGVYPCNEALEQPEQDLTAKGVKNRFSDGTGVKPNAKINRKQLLQ